MILLTALFCEARARTMRHNSLHHHMTENDLNYFFGVDNHLQVPEYDVTSPYQLDERGLPIHDQRQRRTDELRENVFYKVPAFGRELDLNLTLNRKLMSRNLIMETRRTDGTVSHASVPKNTYYLGHVVSDPHSMVAVSNEGGLTGMLKLSSDTLFIHPLPTHLAKRAAPNGQKATPHLIYKRSLQIHVDDQRTKTDLMSTNNKSDEVKKEKMKLKTMEAFLMLEADTAASLERENRDPQQFLLLLGNIISGLLMDPSIGDIRISYVVSGIIVIDKKVLEVEYTDTKKLWMKKLANYLRSINNPDDASPDHFDVCSLIYSMRSGVGGLASLRSMCKIVAGNVNNMVGLQTALVIAHETGHNMGVPHDGSRADCPEGTFIMAPALPGGRSAETWSPCSSEIIQDFLNSNRSSCLNDKAQNEATVVYKEIKPRSIPGNIKFDTLGVRTARDTTKLIDLKKFNQGKQLERFPGEIMSADDQCALQYGKNHRQCYQKRTDCGSLWCTLDGYSCFSQTAPIADGTPCGSRQWCIKGECVDNGRPHINGWWSEWSNFTSCSRTCGGGVQHRKRTCTNPPPSNGGKTCEGKPTGHWRICSIQACPGTSVTSYRNEQCVKARGPGSSAFYYGNPCSLYCKLGNTAQGYGIVADGTRCKKDPSIFDVCIRGVCKTAGCNQVLESDEKIDRCGVCGGNGNSCKHVKGVYNRQWKETGKQNADLIVELPPGTMKAKFVEKSATYNKIGVKSKDGDFVIDPDKSANVKLSYAGATIFYSNKKKRYADTLQITGPTTAKLKIMFIAVYGENTGVEYDLFYHVNHHIKLQYRWIVGDWSVCSATCARGIQRRKIHCVLMEDGSPASDQACDQSQRPIDEHECNQQPCPAEWKVTSWTPCSKTCGTGVQTRRMTCHQRISFVQYQEISPSHCDSNKPPGVSQLSKICNKILCKAEWKIESQWSACSTPCGPGFRQRKVSCILIDEDGRPTKVPEQQCSILEKPADKQDCDSERICLNDGKYQCYPTSPCENGAVCIEQPPESYKCDCLEGFKGSNCEVEIDPCDSNPCQNGGTCQRDSESSLAYDCKCTEWYKGKHCEKNILPCSSSPCHNHATCIDDPNDPTNFFCQCTRWLTGRYCEIKKTKCDEEPCKDRGYCLSNKVDPSWYKCYCHDWFKGTNCETQIFPCDSKPCQNGAVCSNDANNIAEYHCQCKTWFTGKNCEVQLTACDSDPCLNGGYCESDPQTPELYECRCGDWFKGANCQVRIFPCDVKPCFNGGTCRNDEMDISVYHCDCTDGYFGKNCQVPSYIEIGCFGFSKSILKDVLANHKNDFDPAKVKTYIKECGELAFQKGYSHFALGLNGNCLSSEHAEKEYFVKKGTKPQNCKDGIGSKSSIDVYTFEHVPKFVAQGCFVEKSKGAKLLKVKYASFYSNSDPKATVVYCSTLARDMSYEFFAVQNEVECWTSKDIAKTYNKYGKSENCVGGVGKVLANFVYRLQPSYPYPTGCDSDPCQNNGFCVVNKDDKLQYTCECQEMFIGKNCEVQTFPCDSQPCLNGAICANDVKDITKYHCKCTSDYSGVNCQVPSFRQIACFKYSKSLSVLGDFRNDLDWKAADATVEKCAELAFDKEYKHFTLGNNGLCLSGEDISQRYYAGGGMGANKCKQGIGLSGAMYAYTFEDIPKFSAVGCYKENKGSKRLVKRKYASFVSQKNAANPEATIMQCAFVARDMKIEYFALQNYGECWTDDTLGKAYETYAKADESSCKDGIGGFLTNFVYHLMI